VPVHTSGNSLYVTKRNEKHANTTPKKSHQRIRAMAVRRIPRPPVETALLATPTSATSICLAVYRFRLERLVMIASRPCTTTAAVPNPIIETPRGTARSSRPILSISPETVHPGFI